jgi:hypothetical protein
MKRRAASRKVNYASIVKINMPAPVGGCDFSEAAYRQFKSMATQSRFNKLLDNGLVWIIIVFTVTAPACTWVADAGEGFQTRTLAGTRNFKPAAPRGHRPTVCQGHLFRSQRSRPGKVRDASPRAERGPFDHWRGDRFRFLAALVLSSAVCFRGGRARRLGSPQTRSQAGAQADHEVLAFIVATRQKEPSIPSPELVRLIQERFGTKVHPRSIQRSLLRHQKKRR